jgi:hypothetical protein
MKPASNKALDNEQKVFHAQLHVAVQEINEADDLISKHSATSPTHGVATALLLSALARISVLETAAKYEMVSRLVGFAKQPRG